MKYKVYVDWLTQWGKDYLSHLKQIFQGKLTAGQGVTIDENNVISASGGSDDYYTKAEVNNLISNIRNDLSNYYTKTEVSSLIDGYLPLTGGNISGNVKVGRNSIYTNIYGSNDSGSSQDVRLEFRGGYSYGKLIPDDGLVTGNYLRKTNTAYKDHEIVNTVDENTYTLLLPDESGTLAIASKYYTKEEIDAMIGNIN